MADERLLLICHSGLRRIGEAETLSVLSEEELRLPRETAQVDTQQFEAQVEGGVWDASEQYLMRQAQQIRRAADEQGAARLLYFGLAEIPHVTTLGAYLGDERHVEVYDYHRDDNTWQWPAEDQALRLTIDHMPQEKVSMSGPAVIRLCISAAVSDNDVEAVVGSDHVADITVRAEEGLPEVATAVRSAQDVRAVRQAFRSALAALHEARPNVDRIHLFVAAPVSVSFVVGQELHLRNNVPVRTYRYRRRAEGPSYRDAIELTAGEAGGAVEELDEQEVEEAGRLRTAVWPEALREVLDYARMKQSESTPLEGPWHQSLSLREDLKGPNPFPPLPPIWEVAEFDDSVDPEPYPGNEYGHDESKQAWRLSDPLLASLSRAVESDEELRQLIRLFLFHEYVHCHHSLTKYTAEGVGRFANCLERLDYMADLYALLHQVDWTFVCGQAQVRGREKDFLVEQLDLLLRSAWAFVPGATVDRWQVRRVRRLLNWYWRHVQVERSPDLKTALQVLSKPPNVEFVGQKRGAGQGRYFMEMTGLDPSVELSLGLVLEDERLLRIVNSVNYNLEELMSAFQHRQHREVKIFFSAVFEEARQKGGALPVAES